MKTDLKHFTEDRMNLAMQTGLDLFSDSNSSKKIVYIQTDKCTISKFNPRVTRQPEYIKKLAERIQRNGFEVTRAIWAYPENNHYSVFAGGTRLQASKLANIAEIPVVVHEGFTDDQIIKLAFEDNENDEYHEKLSIVDDWLFYKKMADELGWTQEKIASTTGISQNYVSYKISCANFPESIHKKFITNENLKEGHARELLKLSHCDKFITDEQALIEIISNVLNRTKQPTAKNFEDEVKKYNDLFSEVNAHVEMVEDKFKDQFVSLLQSKNVRSIMDVKKYFREILNEQQKENNRIQADLLKQQSEANRQKAELEKQQKIQERFDEINAKLFFGDALTAEYPENIKLLFTDPPYGQDFQSNRRTVANKLEKIANDDNSAFELLEKTLDKIYPKMAEDSTILCWSSKKHLRKFWDIVEAAGFTDVTFLVWDKPNHGSGDLTGSFAPKFECIIHGKKGNPKLNKRLNDVLTGKKFIDAEHPTKKPTDLLGELIEATTNLDDLVVDPFAGIGSTALAAYQTKRNFFICEIDKTYFQAISDMIYGLLKKEF